MNYKSMLLLAILISVNLVVAEDVQLTNETVDNETTLFDSGLDETITIEEISFKNFIPKEFKLGDVQFSIQIQNNRNEAINNVMAFVSGKGFSTYDITPIESLESGEKGYILVNGNFRDSGQINLTIKINSYTFLQTINVLGESQEDIKRAEELARQEEERKRILADLSLKLSTLKQNYSELESILLEKEKKNYDIKALSGGLEELKKYIKGAQASILGEHVEDARINIELAFEEYNNIESKINELKKLPRIIKVKEYTIIFSTIAGAIITFFALYELLKKKGTTSVGIIKEKIEKKKEDKEEVKEKKKDKEEVKEEHK